MASEGFLLKLLKILAPTPEGQKPVLNKKLIFDKLKEEYPNLPQNALTPQLFDLLMDLGVIEKYTKMYTEKNKVYCISNVGETFYELLLDGVNLADIIDGYMKQRGNQILGKENVED
ncbi:MAG: hypothetical protein ACTSRW_06420 [Candidatus Helarchaeota archaeon]